MNAIEIILEKTDYTVDQIAKMLDVSRQSIHAYKTGKTSLSIEQYGILSDETGISIEELIGKRSEKLSGPVLEEIYSNKMVEIGSRVVVAKEKAMDIDTSIVNEELRANIDGTKEQLVKFFDWCSFRIRKPKAVMAGPSDAGKSTLINHLIGKDVIPARYTPMTSTPIYLLHSSEKDKNIEVECENAIVFGRTKTRISEDRFTFDMYESGKYDKAYILKTGDAESILESFGTRDGAYYDRDDVEVDLILIYLDADILKEVTLVDYPGYGTEDENDDVLLNTSLGKFDIVFAVSPTNGYMNRNNEIEFLSSLFNKKGVEDLEYLFLVATHTASVSSPDEVVAIQRKACERIAKAYMQKEDEIAELTEKLSGRCLQFNPKNKHYVDKFNRRFSAEYNQYALKYTDLATSEVIKASGEWVEWYKVRISEIESELNSDKSKYNTTVDKKFFDKSIKEAKKHLAEIKKILVELAKTKKDECARQIEQKYNAIVNEDHIIEIIDNKNYKNNKNDMEDLGRSVIQEIAKGYENIVISESKVYADAVSKNLDTYKKKVAAKFNDDNLNIKMDLFDFEAAFISGLTGVGVYGALGVWAAIVAEGSNLGAYILIAKIVSFLSSIGISLGGTGAVMAFVASIGGPVVLGVGAALICAVAAFGIMSGTWKSRNAKKIIKQLEKGTTLTKLLDNSKKYWDDTEVALDACIVSLEKGIDEFVTNNINEMNLEMVDKIKHLSNKQSIYNQLLATLKSTGFNDSNITDR